MQYIVEKVNFLLFHNCCIASEWIDNIFLKSVNI